MRLADLLDHHDQAPTDLYRYYDRDGLLIYVGISQSAALRAMQHARTAAWWDDWATMTRERFASRDAALRAEQAAIRDEHPRCNVTHNRARLNLQRVV